MLTTIHADIDNHCGRLARYTPSTGLLHVRDTYEGGPGVFRDREAPKPWATYQLPANLTPSRLLREVKKRFPRWLRVELGPESTLAGRLMMREADVVSHLAARGASPSALVQEYRLRPADQAGMVEELFPLGCPVRRDRVPAYRWAEVEAENGSHFRLVSR